MTKIIQNLSRRGFLRGAGSCTGLILGTEVASQGQPWMAAMAASGSGAAFTPNVFLSIPESGPIELVCHRSEMGQGIRTGIPMLLAEELELGLDQVKVVQATGDKAYKDQNTDGSRSIRYNWERLRTMGATARLMLEGAAAKKWQLKPGEVLAKNGRVYHKSSGRSLSYQELASAAKDQATPSSVTLKSPKDYKLIGKKTLAVDRKAFATGQAVYGMDVEVPGMVYAALRRSPTLGGKPVSVKDKEAKKQFGVSGVVTLEELPQPVNTSAAVAVIASNSWAAMQGAGALEVSWQAGPHAKVDSEFYKQKLRKAGEAKKMETAFEAGKPSSKKPALTVSKVFMAPFLVHAPMEPLVATAAPTSGGGVEIWAPTQDPQRIRKAAADFLKVPETKVRVNVSFLGGGFGRKSQPDFAMEAVVLAKKLGKPVKVVWSREDEIKHGFYHAASWQKIKADVDAEGRLLAWHHDSVFPTLMSVFQPGAKKPADFELGMGATNMPYRSVHTKVRRGVVDAPVKVGWLRAVCNIFHCTAVNGMVDELALRQKKDPIAYRLELLGQDRKLDHQDTKRLRQVIEKARQVSGWDSRRKQGRKLGFASHYSFQSYVAVVVEVVRNDTGILVKRVDVVADIGQVVHPEAVISQFEGAAIFGLSAALYGKIELKNGVVVQNNYHDYPVMRMDRSPEIHVELVENHLPPEGAGEPGTPPVVPAVLAAIRELTGKDITELPVAKDMTV